jgi:hypothetical protein
VYFDGTALPTTVNSSEEIEAFVSAQLLSGPPRTISVFVVPGDPGNPPSAGAQFHLTELPAGDMNGDGCVDTGDLMNHLQQLVGDEPTDQEPCEGGEDLRAIRLPGPGGFLDTNYDDQVTIADALYIAQVIAGLLPE